MSNRFFPNYPSYIVTSPFGMRYHPKDKVNTTGYSYESWHFRFVGKEAAIAITERGITLEEYLAVG